MILHLNKILSLLLIGLIFTSMFIVNVGVTEASYADDLAAVQKKLAEIRNKKSSIQNDISKQSNLSNQFLREINELKNKINLLDNLIAEKELVINELEIQINIANEEIAKTESEIISTEDDVEELQIQTDNRMVDMYIKYKTASNLTYVASDGKKDLIKLNVYQKSIQDKTNDIVTELNVKKNELSLKKEALKISKANIEKDKALIETEKLAIVSTKVDLDQQKALYTKKRNESLAYLGSAKNYLESVTFEEQKALAEQQRLEQIIFDSVKQIQNGTYVTTGTVVGYQGCTGLCTGPHLHFAVKSSGSYVNPCSTLPSGIISGCGTSSATLSWPMSGSFVLTSGYGMRWGKMHYGIDIANYQSAAPIKAAHDGWLVRGFAKCDPNYWLCKGGGANYVIICENKNNCNIGKTTMYYHLK